MDNAMFVQLHVLTSYPASNLNRDDLGRPKTVVSADALYGATINMFLRIFEPLGVKICYTDIYDAGALGRAVQLHQPGCILMETISNPVLRVGDIGRVAEAAHAAGVLRYQQLVDALPHLDDVNRRARVFDLHGARQTDVVHQDGELVGLLPMRDLPHVLGGAAARHVQAELQVFTCGKTDGRVNGSHAVTPAGRVLVL